MPLALAGPRCSELERLARKDARPQNLPSGRSHAPKNGTLEGGRIAGGYEPETVRKASLRAGVGGPETAVRIQIFISRHRRHRGLVFGLKFERCHRVRISSLTQRYRPKDDSPR